MEQITEVDGGWVGSCRPNKNNEKVRISDVKPYFVPKELRKLNGADYGLVKLPYTLFWSGENKFFDLKSRSGVMEYYATVMQEGEINDIINYLNYDVLKSVFNILILPNRLKDMWIKFHGKELNATR